jgi:ABC-type branched-subunit amino acid transport system ATPase component
LKQPREREEIEEILSFMGLQEVKYRLAGALPYGTQKRVELARAIAVTPTLRGLPSTRRIRFVNGGSGFFN